MGIKKGKVKITRKPTPGGPIRGPHYPKLGGTWDERGPHTGGPEPF